MKDEETKKVGRRALLSNMSVAAVAGLAASAAAVSAPAQAQSSGFSPARHSADTWMAELPGSHRVFIDSSTLLGGANAVRYANNIIQAHEIDYDGKASDYALIVCFRHTSVPFAFDDAIWAKYGAIFDRSADPAPSTNPMNTASMANGQTSLADLRAYGVKVVICSKATASYARAIAAATGASADEVNAELVAGAIPEGRFVAAGVMAATRSQEYSYSLLYAG